jgi:hypothetical protein
MCMCMCMCMRLRLHNPPLIARKYKKPAFNYEAGY